MTIILSIDPSIRYCGMSMWETDKETKVAELLSFDCISNHSSNVPLAEWMRAAISNAKALEPYIKIADLILLEQPKSYATGKGYAAMQSQSLLKLVQFCGMITYIIGEHKKKLHTIFPEQWKGQLPKRITTIRINKKMGLSLDWKDTRENNSADAIGLAIYWLKARKYTILEYQEKSDG